MKKLIIHTIILYIFLLNICSLQECPPSDTLNVNSSQDLWNIPYNNNWNGLEIMTWNLEDFPISGNTTIDHVQEIISDMLPDIIGFQELKISDFNSLADMMPSYGFIITNYTGQYNSELQLGFAYRKDCVEISSYSTLFQNNSYPFGGRPPLKAEFIWSCGGITKPFQVVNLHFKAYGDSESFARRLEASEILLSYIKNEVQQNNLVNIIAIGDFNDSLDDPQENNSLWPLVDSDDVYFVDTNIANGSSQNWSYPSYPSHIDHILINQNLFDEYENSSVSTVKIDNYTGYSDYSDISDHRPVMWKFIINDEVLQTGLVINEIMNNPSVLIDSNEEWFEIINIGDDLIDLYGLTIRDQGTDVHIINEHLYIGSNELLVLGASIDQSINGNVPVDYEYSDFNLSNNSDEIIIIDQNQNIIDQVYYDFDENFPDNEGYSMALIDPDSDNNIGDNWFQSNIIMNNGDYGTPGYQNNFSCQSSGNSNLDDIVNIVDIVFTVGYILGNQEFSNDNFCEADMDLNGVVNVVDIVSVIGYILEGN
tara:strand:- start:39 stop:1649 length:1611 start_codon:yes stop_codon:yes gene_type:complete